MINSRGVDNSQPEGESSYCFGELSAKQKNATSASPLRPLPARLNAGKAGPVKQDSTRVPLRFTNSIPNGYTSAVPPVTCNRLPPFHSSPVFDR